MYFTSLNATCSASSAGDRPRPGGVGVARPAAFGDGVGDPGIALTVAAGAPGVVAPGVVPGLGSAPDRGAPAVAAGVTVGLTVGVLAGVVSGEAAGEAADTAEGVSAGVGDGVTSGVELGAGVCCAVSVAAFRDRIHVAPIS